MCWFNVVICYFYMKNSGRRDMRMAWILNYRSYSHVEHIWRLMGHPSSPSSSSPAAQPTSKCLPSFLLLAVPLALIQTVHFHHLRICEITDFGAAWAVGAVSLLSSLMCIQPSSSFIFALTFCFFKPTFNF
ncbi:hypothetical protein ANO14919_095960 [Xylariales sp. No.14919]|nr:hypothetical protein ANO14919_095960 [Xylariales sp. No.14919]